MSTNTAPRKTVLDGLGNAPGSRPPQLWQVPTFCAGVLALLVVALVTPFSLNCDKEIERDLTNLRRGLAQANPDLERLLPLADDLLARSQKYPQAVGEIHYLVGTAYMRQADRLSGNPARDVRTQALAHLEQAEARGVPAADRNRLYYRLGRVVYLNGGDLPRAIAYMNRGCPLGSDDAFEGYGLLVQGYLKMTPPDVDAALRANQKQIELSDDDAAVAASRLQRAELLLKKDLRSEALKALDLISRKAPQNLQMRAKALQARCCQEDGLFNRATRLWQELLAEPSVVSGGKGRILYMLGICQEQDDPPSISQARKAFEEAMAFGGEEAQAAALRLADSLLDDSPRTYTALPHFQFALETVSAAAPYQNSLIDLNTARRMFERGCSVYSTQHNHLALKLLAEAYQKIALPGIAEERQAEAAEEHGKHLRDRAKTPGPEAATYLEKSKAEFRRAAQAYEVASKTRDHADYLKRLARSADCWVQAQEYQLAEEQLKRLLGPDVPPAQQSEAWFALANVYQALQKTKKEVQECYHHCIELGLEPFANNARLQLGMLEFDQENYGEAEKIWKEATQVHGTRLPCEDVFVRLAEVYIKQKQYEPASVYLKEAIRNYPNSPHLLSMRDKLGDCYRKLADQDWSELRKSDPPLSAGKKSFYLDAYREHLEQARDVFQKLADDLESLTQGRKLSGTEDLLQRKAMFVAADCLRDLGNSFGEVLRRYEDLARRNQNRVEGLMACERLLSCYNAITEEVLKQQARKVTMTAFANALTYLPAIPDIDFRIFGPTGTKQDFRNWLLHYSEWLKTH